MAYNFPNSPAVDDIFGRYKWDGEKWILTVGGRPKPPPPTVTWDPTTINGVTLSGGNLSVTNNGYDDMNQGARVASANGKSTGKHYFEIILTNLQNTGGNIVNCWGVAMVSSSYYGVGSAGSGAVTMGQNGTVIMNGSGMGGASVGQRATGDVIGVAVDLTNKRHWFRVAPSGNWNNSGTANPATNVEGIDISVLTGVLAPICTFGYWSTTPGNIFTANFGASAFIGAVPSGFASGWLI